METVILEPTFDYINRNAQPYPSYLLPQHGTALSLFSAGFHGWNDVIHMVRKEMRVTCVDVDDDKLWGMAQVYPGGLEFHTEDAWEFAQRWSNAKRTWDVVSVDPFMGDAAERVWDSMRLWSKLANKLVTVTVDPKQPLWAPAGWTAHLYPRSIRASWMVLRRA